MRTRISPAKRVPGHREAAIFALLAASLLWAAGCEETCPPGFTPVVLPEFMLGFSQVPVDVVPIATEIGVRYLRPTFSWRSIEPVVEVRGLTVEGVRANPAMISEYIAAHGWSVFDGLVASYSAAGLETVPIVGHGYTGTLPLVDGQVASPDRLGREDYLGHQYLFTRAVVERYDADGVDDAPGSPRIDLWQTENELNQAFLTALWGWREPSFQAAFGSAWQDWSFVTSLLETLRLAVKDADPTALTTMNFHTDIAPALNHGMFQPSWIDAVIQWRFDMDVLGMDAYPNYYLPDPVRGTVVGERVSEIALHSCGMPIAVMETGYPTGPAIEGFDEAKQAQYIGDAYASAVAAGASGYFQFGARTSDTHSVEITPEDLANLTLVGEAYEEGNFWKLITFALWNMDYLQNHFVNVLQAVEPYWGLVRPDGSHKPGWDALHEIALGLP